MKKGFRCIICDFDNGVSIDINQKITYFNKDVCHKIVDNTFEYFYYFNSFVWKYINTVNFLAHCSSSHLNFGEFKLNASNSFDFIPIENSLYVEDCNYALMMNLKDEKKFAKCLNYCEKYNFFTQS